MNGYDAEGSGCGPKLEVLSKNLVAEGEGENEQIQSGGGCSRQETANLKLPQHEPLSSVIVHTVVLFS
jgi:hypothetical protein